MQVRSGLVGVSSQTMRVSGDQPSRERVEIGEVDGGPGVADGAVDLGDEAVGAAVGVVAEEDPLAGRSRRSTLSSAASPDAKARPWVARSSEATHASSAARVGLPEREYS